MPDDLPSPSVPRREFIKFSALALGAMSAIGRTAAAGATPPLAGAGMGADDPVSRHEPNEAYEGPNLSRVAFPLGGIGAGMVALEGGGSLAHVSIRNRPDVFNAPRLFAAVSVPSHQIARVLEGPVPGWKIFGDRGGGFGAGDGAYGLPRFARARFSPRFPFATVTLTDESIPLGVDITGWSPFTPGDADSSSWPVAALEYVITNRTTEAIDGVFSFNAHNFVALAPETSAIRATPGGFILLGSDAPRHSWADAAFAVAVDDPAAKVNCSWFRGGWYDPLTMAWNDVVSGACYDRAPTTDDFPSNGASVFVPFHLAPGAARKIVVRLSWFAGVTNVTGRWNLDDPLTGPTYVPWYAGKFKGIDDVVVGWDRSYAELRQRSAGFADCFYSSTLPPEIVEAVAANLGILKSPTVLRQVDGKMWAWEGSGIDWGSCPGTCTHVWNYAQAVAHLFPELERSLRETEFGPSQDDRGHQAFRSALPIGPTKHDFYAAADGQLGGIMKVHRDWRISGDTSWLKSLWPKVRQSLDYCIATWDPGRKGWLEEPHHNTYDIEFWGPEPMCTSIYLGALRAAVVMGQALGDDISRYQELLDLGRKRIETELFDGEHFIQKIQWKGLRASDPTVSGMGNKVSAEAIALIEKEGPKYQYGAGCLSDGVLGAWLAVVCGVGDVLDREKVASHLRAVHRYNFKTDLSAHANPQRPGYALGHEAGLLLCTWPKGGALSLPFVYSREVWTGIEYQVASHLIAMGLVDEGLQIVRACRARYDGTVRNPFDEYECGHWYARALASYALLQSLSGARYDAVEKVLHLRPQVSGDFRCFLATATGFGSVGVHSGQPFLDVRSGAIEVARIDYTPCARAG